MNKDDHLIHEGWKDIVAAAGLGLAAGCSPGDPNCPPEQPEPKEEPAKVPGIDYEQDVKKWDKWGELKEATLKIGYEGRTFYYGQDDYGKYMAVIYPKPVASDTSVMGKYDTALVQSYLTTRLVKQWILDVGKEEAKKKFDEFRDSMDLQLIETHEEMKSTGGSVGIKSFAIGKAYLK